MWEPKKELFGGSPPHLVDEETGGVAWITDPLGFVVRLSPERTHVDLAVARFMMGPVERLAYARRTSDAERIYWVADWSHMTGYDVAARRVLTDWAKARRATIRRLVAVVPPQQTVARMGLAMAEAALFFVNLRLEIRDEFDDTVRSLGIAPRMHP